MKNKVYIKDAILSFTTGPQYWLVPADRSLVQKKVWDQWLQLGLNN